MSSKRCKWLKSINRRQPPQSESRPVQNTRQRTSGHSSLEVIMENCGTKAWAHFFFSSILKWTTNEPSEGYSYSRYTPLARPRSTPSTPKRLVSSPSKWVRVCSDSDHPSKSEPVSPYHQTLGCQPLSPTSHTPPRLASTPTQKATRSYFFYISICLVYFFCDRV